MPYPNQYGRKSYIKDVCIEVPGYRFSHHPYIDEAQNNFEFVGREESSQQILDILLRGDNNGAYLVAGYRGMGKTSFINKVLGIADKRLRKEKKRRLRQVNVSFGKSNMVYNDLLKQLIFSLLKNVVDGRHRTLLWLVRPSKILVLAILIFLGFVFSLFQYPSILSAESAGGGAKSVLYIAIISLIIAFIVIKIFSLIIHLSPAIRIFVRLTKLYTRTTAEISEEENIQSMIKDVNFGLFSKNYTKYPPLSSKEIEMELIEIINRIDRTSKKPWRGSFWRWINRLLARAGSYRENMYVFVFDEMDKIDPTSGGDEYYKDMRESRVSNEARTYIDEQRDRRQMMVNIVSSMKNLITSAQAKFIFITGREMFEASLADIADRQFSLGSIFHKIIYVDSFLKDKQGVDPSGLSNLIENYLKYVLLPSRFIKEWEYQKGPSDIMHRPFLYLYQQYLNDINYIDQDTLDREEKRKVILLLQQFIIYLTYRSNGSPKKLTRIVEEFMQNEGRIFNEKTDAELLIAVHRRDRKKGKPARLYLHLSYNDQFRFGFITYLYRPFLLNYSRRLKNYSDYLLVSTTYLFDHIIKFHPAAFSTKNLELLPEVLSSNRSPQLRSFIDDILHFLSHSYIRETEISLFEYKFFNKVYNEVLHLTNLFEEESAAFNFTLDESYPIKTHIRNKILDLRSIHKDYRITNYEFIHSISALNNLLGDLRFFDQEYNDAITAYSDALQALHNLEESNKERMDLLILKIQLQLKIGLTFEKIKTYENALACFTEAMNDVLVTVRKYCSQNSRNSFTTTTISVSETHNYHPSQISLHELMITAVQSYIANLYLIEKINPRGVQVDNIAATFLMLNELFDHVHKYKNKPDLTKYLAFNHVSVLLFYKNLSIKDIKQLWVKMNSQHLFAKTGSHHFWNDLENKSKDYRFPGVSFHFELLALNELVEYQEGLFPTPGFLKSLINQLGFSKTEELFFIVFYLTASGHINKISDKSLLIKFAVSISRMGDILLTNINHEGASGGNSTDKLQDVFSDHFLQLIGSYNKLSDGKENNDQVFQNFISQNKNEIKGILKSGLTGNSSVRIKFVLICYYLSSKYYSAAGKMAQCASQLKRILRVVNSVTSIDDGLMSKVSENKRNELLKVIEEWILFETLKNISTNTNSTDRLQILRYKYYFNITDQNLTSQDSKFIYSNLSNSPEIREAILLYAELRMNLFRFRPLLADDLNSLIEEQGIINSTNSISFQWTRVQELNFQSDLNFKLIKEYFSPQFNKLLKLPAGKSFHLYWIDFLFPLYSKLSTAEAALYRSDAFIASGSNDVTKEIKNRDIHTKAAEWKELLNFFKVISKQEADDDVKKLVIQFLQTICNSMHSINHIIEILQTYGANYPAGYVFSGEQYKRMGTWMRLFQLGLLLESSFLQASDYDLKIEVEKLIGIEPLRNLEPMACFQTAIHFYRRALELHHEGNAYKNKIQTLNYLDDDFNDSIDHFACALERQQINSGSVRDTLNKLEKILNRSQLFRYNSYVN